ncbi:hypothetical protein DFH08DRAFT_849542 [Mycena albidolilacea]|uniref:Uncharacterized protein n=1 Tax=Mycena albidolilacea TaxID=1033008 RepID=A0AAD7AFL4_9AGAR|nr:hypothetical protein DFH08DRAFT_849542 [Mycena albidolilacea]
MPDQTQYAPAARAPLIKSPSLRVPRPIVLPPDIHPLPDSVTPYFVYPYTLEPHVLTLESSRRATLASHTTRREEYLRARADEKERRKRDALRRIAPGLEPDGHLLVPTKRSSVIAPAVSPQPPKSVMEDLVDQLAALDSASSSSPSVRQS